MKPTSVERQARHPRQPLHESFRHAIEGLGYVLREERNARIHVISALLVLGISTWLGLSTIEWALIIACIALVFVGEMLNTVVEITIDLIMPQTNPLAKRAKDVAAGAILIASIMAAITGFLVLGPKLWLYIVPFLKRG